MRKKQERKAKTVNTQRSPKMVKKISKSCSQERVRYVKKCCAIGQKKISDAIDSTGKSAT